MFTLISLLCLGPSHADNNSQTSVEVDAFVEIHDANHPKLQRVVKRTVRRIQRRRIMGSVVLVSYQGQIVYLDSKGWQNKKEKQPMTLDTLFRMYSLSKPVTSVAVLQLVEKELIGLDDPIDKHIPELSNLKVYNPLGNKEVFQAPTVADLLRHSAGFSYGFFGVGPVDGLYNLNHPLLAEDSDGFVERLSTLPLAFEPGSGWRYGVSTDVLGVLVERVSGQTLDEYLSQNIFEPLDMVDTGFVVADEDIDRFGPMYTRFGVELEPVADSPFRSKRFESGGGGLVSTMHDYNQFAQMIVQQGTLGGVTILSPESVSFMQTNQLPEGVRSVNGDGFGFGFQVQIEPNKQSPVGEYTWDGIGSTHFWASPEHQLYVIALSQYMPFIPVLKYSLRPRIYKALDIEWER